MKFCQKPLVFFSSRGVAASQDRCPRSQGMTRMPENDGECSYLFGEYVSQTASGFPAMIRITLGSTPKEQERAVIAAIACLSLCIFAADITLPLGFVIWTLYLVPLLMSVWIGYRYAPFFMAGLLFIALLLGHFVVDSLPRSATDLADRGIFILVIAIVALLAWEIRQSYASLEEEIVERRTAQEQLEALTGTLEMRVAERTGELSKVNDQLTCDIAERKRIEAALAMANQKLLLLSQITRHDISNRVFALLVNLELAKEQVAILKDPEIEENIQSMEKNIAGIQAQVAFAKDYQEIGAQTPKWHPVDAVIRAAAEQLNLGDTAVEINTGETEIFSDPMIGRVFYNLIDNALRHGGRVTRITFSYNLTGSSLGIICADDGVGIPDMDKQHIFTKGFGKDSGLGLFLIQEILAITGITIRECGRYGEGACFALQVPEGQFRIGTVTTT